MLSGPFFLNQAFVDLYYNIIFTEGLCQYSIQLVKIVNIKNLGWYLLQVVKDIASTRVDMTTEGIEL